MERTDLRTGFDLFIGSENGVHSALLSGSTPREGNGVVAAVSRGNHPARRSSVRFDEFSDQPPVAYGRNHARRK